MTKHNISIVCLMLSLTCGCTSKAEKAIIGWWQVDKILYDNKNIMPCFTSNILRFRKDNTCLVPFTSQLYCPTIKAFTEQGNWVFHQDEMVLIINSKNQFFDKKYHVKFYDNKIKNRLVMRLSSSTDTIICTKGFYSYDSLEVKDILHFNKK